MIAEKRSKTLKRGIIMEYSKTYFLRYLSANEEVRKASKNHWLQIHAAHIANGDTESETYSLSASILAAIAVADDLIEKQIVVSA